jgi:hypothetical protein
MHMRMRRIRNTYKTLIGKSVGLRYMWKDNIKIDNGIAHGSKLNSICSEEVKRGFRKAGNLIISFSKKIVQPTNQHCLLYR